MAKTKKARCREALAETFPEIQEINQEISELLKERRRLTQKLSRQRLKDYEVRKKLGWPVSIVEKKSKSANLFSKRLSINSRIHCLEQRAQKIHKEVNDLIWLSDNPNIRELRKDLFFMAKMIGDFNG